MEKKCILFIIGLLLLCTSNFFNYSNLDITFTRRISYVIFLALGLLFYIRRKAFKHINMPLKKIVLILFFLPLLCIITKEIYWREPWYDERVVILSSFSFLLYYIFYVCHITEREIIKLFTLWGLIILGIQLFQQFYPANAVFGIYNSDLKDIFPEEIAEVRNDMYRFRLGTNLLTLICLYYYWDKFRTEFKLSYLILFIAFLTSTYLYLTRQLIFATLLALGSSAFFIKGVKFKIGVLILICILVIIGYQYIDFLFQDLLNQTVEDANSSNIRLIAFGFFWEKIQENILTFIGGNGHPSILFIWQEQLKLFPSDIGIVGAMFYHGVLWVALYFYTVFCMLKKYASFLPLYIKLFIFGTFINSIFIFPYSNSFSYLIWCSMLYIASVYIKKEEKDI